MEMVPMALRTFIDISSYWSQLTFTLAIALERCIIIVGGTKASVILKKRNRVIFYVIVLVVISITPALVMWDFFEHVDPSALEPVSTTITRKIFVLLDLTG